ncbi:MAG: 50S ribosomal protein L21 [Rhodobiaceae bacterium]|nr:50S ribosomal protein L21 [Rhodobiaceae bacterium]MCC0016238.1 50S ribosomal protein L21 [Rhodobiaceae bacterium]MCC0041157.1 50S ribosomal protein L21 [Rhodobiaceae bacterium]
MFAVIKTGGKQYRVAADDVISVEKLAGEPGDIIAFESVLMVGEGADATIGSPTVEGATVAGEVVEQTRGPKVIAFKKRRRKNSRRKRGHRQHLTMVKITEILTGGAKPKAAAKKAAPKAESKPVAAEAATSAGGGDIELIAGVGPAIKKKLVAAGVTSWEQIAGWSAADIERFDAELNLRGRIEREEWVEQARELLAGKPPRAKVDQKAAEKSAE